MEIDNFQGSIEISSENKDFLNKYLADHYQDDFNEVFQIFPNSDSAYRLPGEPTVDPAHLLRPDRVYCVTCDDGRKIIVNIEFESRNDSNDLIKYIRYALHLSIYYGQKHPFIPIPVRIVVIYPDTVSKPSSIYLDDECLRFKIIQISVGDYINGDQLLAEYLELVKSSQGGQIPSLSGKIVVKLSLAIFGRVSGDRKVFCQKMIALGKQLAKNPDNRIIFILIIISSFKFLSLAELNKLTAGENMEPILAALYSGKYSDIREYFEEVNKVEIAKKDAVISEQGAVISEKDAVISEKDALLSEKDVILTVFKMALQKCNVADISRKTNLSVNEIDEILASGIH
jgi:hypothetical protein